MKPEVGNDYNRSKADSSKQPTDGRDWLHQSKAEDRWQTAGNNKIQYDWLPTLEQGIALVDKYATDTKKHLMAVGYVMKHFAKKLGQNELAWQLAGMLHDIDWDYTGKNVHDHCTETFEKMADEINLPQSIRTDIKSHAHFITWVQPTTLLWKYLCALDELTGFVGAVARVQPNKTLEEVKPASVAKKIKDKSFAKWVDRTEVRNAETMLGLNMEEVIQEIIDALKPYAKELWM